MAKLKSILFPSLTLLCLSAATQPKAVDDRGPNLRGGWPTTMTLRVLEGEGLVDASQIDESRTRTERLASQKVGKDLWNQIYFVQVELRTGKTVEAIAQVNASSWAEMRMGPVVYVVSKVLQPEGVATPRQR